MESSSSLVLLGHINDVPQRHLEGPGTDRLDTLLDGADTSRAVRSALDQLPAEGWRKVKEIAGGGFHEEVWGCPATSGWWVLTFNHVRGVRHALVIPEPVDPIPQPQRAEGLTLRWAPPTIVARAGELREPLLGCEVGIDDGCGVAAAIGDLVALCV